jgi:hypothetical protein
MAEVIDNTQGVEAYEQGNRDAFEAELQEEAGRLIASAIVDAIKARTGTYSERLHEAILRNLFERFTRDKGPLMEHFSGLRQLPRDAEARTLRLKAFEEILHHYLPHALREEIPSGTNEEHGGVSRESTELRNDREKI